MDEYHIIFSVFMTIINMIYCEKIEELSPEYLYDVSEPKDRCDVFSLDKNEPNYETVSIESSKPNGSSDDEIHFSFTAFGGEIKLSLKKTDYFIVNPNTPVYDLTSKADGNVLCKEIPLNINPLEGYYEDKKNFAFFYISVDANGIKRIETGVIKAKKLTIQRISNYFILPDGKMLNVSKTNNYIVQRTTDIPNNYSVLTDAEMSDKNSSLSSIPKVIYPKVLLMVDHDFLNKSRAFEGGFTASIKYLINFWSRVHMMFRNLIKPEFKISIAGIVVDRDAQVFDFITKNSLMQWGGFKKVLKYNPTYDEMKKWLLHKSLDCIPLKSYSIAITHTPTFPECYLKLLRNCTQLSKWGVAKEATSCFVENILNIPSLTKINNVALLYDDRFFNNVRLAADEVATALGILKDDDSCRNFSYFTDAVSTVRPNQNKWSDCSLKGFKAFLKSNPTCLYNAPE